MKMNTLTPEESENINSTVEQTSPPSNSATQPVTPTPVVEIKNKPKIRSKLILGGLICILIIGAIYFILNYKIKYNFIGENTFYSYSRNIFGIVFESSPVPCSSLFPLFPCPNPPATNDIPIYWIDAGTFTFVGNMYPNSSGMDSFHAVYKDKDHVIISGYVISNSDPATLKVLNGYAIDTFNMYASGMVFSGMDTSTIEMLPCRFYKDKNHVYSFYTTLYTSGNPPINDIDATSFEVLDKQGLDCESAPYIAKDKNNYYKLNDPLRNTDNPIVTVNIDSANQ